MSGRDALRSGSDPERASGSAPGCEGRSGTIVRAPNHLGDAVAALPALVAYGADMMVVRALAPLLELAGVPGAVLPLDRGTRGFARAARELRRRGYERGVLLTPAFSAAWLFRWGGVQRLRGTATDGRSVLLAERVPPEVLRPHHRTRAYDLLLGRDPSGPPRVHRLVPPAERIDRWRASIDAARGAHAAATSVGPERAGGRPVVGLFPGANAPARRWPPERFGAVAREALSRGARVVVLGGPGEVALTAAVAAAAPGAIDFGGRTDLLDLAALLSLCDVVVTNDTGPMHLAGAIGTPTVSLWGSSDPHEVHQVGAPDVRVSGPALPCKPCRRNRCGRRGRGTLLAHAHEECMRLIEVREVLEAVFPRIVGEATA